MRKFKKAIEKIKTHLTTIAGVIGGIILYESDKRLSIDRETMRNFKVNIRTGFFGNKIEYIQREKPLTDDELDLMHGCNIKKNKNHGKN